MKPFIKRLGEEIVNPRNNNANKNNNNANLLNSNNKHKHVNSINSSIYNLNDKNNNDNNNNNLINTNTNDNNCNINVNNKNNNNKQNNNIDKFKQQQANNKQQQSSDSTTKSHNHAGFNDSVFSKHRFVIFISISFRLFVYHNCLRFCNYFFHSLSQKKLIYYINIIRDSRKKRERENELNSIFITLSSFDPVL